MRTIAGFRSTCQILITSLLLILVGSQVLAVEPEDVLFYKAGPLTLRPQFSLSEMYNDNIFYQHSDAVEDFVTTISPGLKLQLGRPEHNYLSLGYTLDELFYANNPDLDTPQHTLEIKDQFVWQRLKLIGVDHFQYLNSPLGGVVERIIGTNGLPVVVGQNVARTSIDDSYTLSYDLGDKTSIYGRGTHTMVDYQEGVPLYDIETWIATVGFAYRAFPKTIFFGELYCGQTFTGPNEATLPKNPRLDFLGGYVGARGSFTEKLSGTVKVGYETRTFSDGTSAPSDPVVDLALTQQFSEKRALTLTYSRQENVSIQYSRETYTADVIGLQFTQLLGTSRKWQVGANVSYTLFGYQVVGTSNTSTEYDYFRGSLSLAYQLQRWMTASLGYEYEQVIGNTQSAIDYTVNRVSLRLAIGF
jgi:hypothetical protein